MRYSAILCLLTVTCITEIGTAQTITKQFEQTRYDIRDLHMLDSLHGWATGRQIAILVNEIKPAGNHTVQWEGTDDSGRQVSSGVFICKLISGEGMESKIIMMVQR